MRKISLFFIFSLITCLAWGQIKIKGKIQDEKESLPLATILVTDSVSTTFSIVSDSLGRFYLQIPKAGKYHFLIEYIGYEKFQKSFEINENTSEIQIQLEPNKIDEVVVVGRRPRIERKVDGVVLRWANPAMLKGLTMQEALRRLPMMTRGKTGLPEVVMKDRTVYYLNGKRSFLSNEQILQLLESLPAEEIERIEVITNPGAEYDEQGNVAIVKIFLKTSSLYSKMYASAWTRQNSYNSQAIDFTWIKQNKWHTTLNLSAKNSAKRVTHNAEFYENDRSAALLNYQTIDYKGNLSGSAAFIASRNLPKNQEIEIQASANISSTRPQPVVEKAKVVKQAWQAGLWQTTGEGIQQNSQKDQKVFQNVGIFYKKQYSQSAFSGNLVFTNFSNDKFATLYYHEIDYLIAQEQKIKQNIQSTYFRTDYKTTLKNNTLAAGVYGAYTFNQTNTHWQENILSRSIAIFDTSYAFQYQYNEQYFTPFVSWSKQWSERWQSKIGLRVENTFNRGKIDGVQKFTNLYINPLPDVNIMYAKNENHIWNFTSRGFIGRPEFWQLNPYRYYISPNFYVENNPFLQPSYVIENTFAYTLKQKLTFALQWSYQMRRESQINIQEGNNNVVKRFNTNDENWYIANVNYSEIFWKQRWQMNFSLMGVWAVFLPYAEFANVFYRTSFPFGSISLDNTLLLLQRKNTLLNLNFGFFGNSSGYQTNFFMKPTYNIYAALTCNFKDWTFSIETEDISRGMAIRGDGIMNTRTFLMNNYNDDRMVRLRIRYVFGRKVVSQKESKISQGDIEQRISK
ncbi:MAG: TonB-dependent receptor family protein [Raineya sp.]|nr:TonB-dependent receptor family protein [Raineya sp.]